MDTNLSFKTILLRAIHILFGSYFFVCLGYIYYCGLNKRIDLFVDIAIGSLVIEGIILLISGGKCPISLWQIEHGDEKGFFGLFLPKPFLPYVTQVFSIISVVGMILVLLAYLEK